MARVFGSSSDRATDDIIYTEEGSSSGTYDATTTHEAETIANIQGDCVESNFKTDDSEEYDSLEHLIKDVEFQCCLNRYVDDIVSESDASPVVDYQLSEGSPVSGEGEESFYDLHGGKEVVRCIPDDPRLEKDVLDGGEEEENRPRLDLNPLTDFDVDLRLELSRVGKEKERAKDRGPVGGEYPTLKYLYESNTSDMKLEEQIALGGVKVALLEEVKERAEEEEEVVRGDDYLANEGTGLLGSTPLEAVKFSEEATPLEAVKISDETTPLEAVKISDETTPLEAVKISDETTPLEAVKISDETTPLEAVKISDETTPLEAVKISDETTPLEAVKISDEATPLEAVKISEETTPLEAVKISDEVTPLEAIQISDETTPLEAVKISEEATPLEALKISEEATPLEAVKISEEATPLEAVKISEEATPLEAVKISEEATPLEAVKISDEATPLEAVKISDETLSMKAKVVVSSESTTGTEINPIAIIDEEVLETVKSLIESNQCNEENKSSNLTPTPEAEKKQLETSETKPKEKKKKKKKKRSNSKSERSSPSSTPSCSQQEKSVPEKRKILKRGTTWKGKMEFGKSNSENVSAVFGGLRDSCSIHLEVKSEDSLPDDCETRSPPQCLESKSSPPGGEGVCFSNGWLSCGEDLSSVVKDASEDLGTESCDAFFNFVPTNLSSASETLTLGNKVEDAKNFESKCILDDEEQIFASHPDEVPVNENRVTLSYYNQIIQSRLDTINEDLISNDSTETQVSSCPEDEGVKDLSNGDAKDSEVILCLTSDDKTWDQNLDDELKRDATPEPPQPFTFSTSVTRLQPMKPSIEYVSDSSSLSTRSSSVDKSSNESNSSVVNAIPSRAYYEGGEDSSDDDMLISPLFEFVEVSPEVTSAGKLTSKSRKRHSLPKSNALRRRLLNLNSKSLDDENAASSDSGAINLFEDGGDFLYHEKCECAVEKTAALKGSTGEGDVNPSSAPSRSDNVHLDNDPRTLSDDSDSTDTWHHKNIKEKIKKIIGARLQPRSEVESSLGKKKANSEPPPANSSSENQSPKDQGLGLSSLSKEGIPPSPKEGESPREEEANCEGEEFPPRDDDCSEGDGAGKRNLSFDSKHFSITFLTDSGGESEGSSKRGALSSRSNDCEKEENGGVLEPNTCILERWEALQTKALEQQRQSTQLRQLQRQVKSLRLSLENILRQCSSIANPLAIESPSQFPSKLEEVKGLLSETETLRQDLSNLNILVHRFSSETGFAATPLKDEMAELYRMWDETHRRVSGEFSRLQNAELCWHLWEEQKANLSEALKQDFNTLKVIDAAIDNGKLTDSVTASVRDVAKLLNERRNAPNGSKAKILLSSESAETKLMELKNKTEVKEDRLSDSGTSGYESCSSDDLSERERRLAYLRRLARDLEATLVPGSKAWEDINNTLAQAEKELKELQDHCRSLIHRTTEALDPSVKHSRFHTNNKRRNISREGKNCRVTRSERRGKNGGSRKEWIWRVARAAVPFQAALLLLLCVTCLLEPSCCDSVNTFNLSFGPQLRFVPGSPPV